MRRRLYGYQLAALSGVSYVAGFPALATFFSTENTPAVLNANDNDAITLGMKFTPAVDGSVYGVRFYKATTNTGTHVGKLYSVGGAELASVTFTGETASGWQEAIFSSPVAVTASTTYVIAYHTSVGQYSVTSAYFTPSPIARGDITAPTAAGVFTYGASPALPTSSFNDANYWVDVVFHSGVGGTIPLSWDDPIFGSNVASDNVTVADGGSVSNKSITTGGGDGQLTASVVFGAGGTMNYIRINSREGVRVGGAGTFNVTNSYIEATGVTPDHADGIQAYSPGDTGTLNIAKSTIRSHNNDATAGLFIADNWTGAINLTDVVVNGGPYGVRIYPDIGGDNHISFKNVYFVGPFGFSEYDFADVGGHVNVIDVWDNVREAAIVNGTLVLGAFIPKPF